MTLLEERVFGCLPLSSLSEVYSPERSSAAKVALLWELVTSDAFGRSRVILILVVVAVVVVVRRRGGRGKHPSEAS